MITGKITLVREKRIFHGGFCVTKEELPDLIKNLPHLHRDEKEYYDTLRFDRRKSSYLLGRIVAKKAVCEIIEEENLQSVLIDFGIFQFPVVKHARSQNVQVSISHCDNIGIALAFPEEHPMGIDIEKADADKIETMKSQITEKELELIAGCDLPSAVCITAMWTIKEALSKIFKTGLTFDFKRIEIKSLEKSGPVYLSTFCDYPQYKALSCYAGDYICSVVLPKNTIPGLEHLWDAFANTVLK